jgi:hypothetical protein
VGGENFITRIFVVCTLLIIRIIKPREMKWAGHVARMEEKRKRICYWWESQRERATRKTKK